MNDKQLAALARKNAAKAARVQQKRQRSYDDTVDATRPADAPDDSDAEKLFKEMKKREF